MAPNALAVLLVFWIASAPSAFDYPFQNPDLDDEERISDLIERMTLDAGDLSHWDSDKEAWVVEPGPVELLVGRSSRDADLVLSMTLESPAEGLSQERDMVLE